MIHPEPNSPEPTPVDDVRRVRERLDREASGDIHALAEQSRAAVELHRGPLNLKLIKVPISEVERDDKIA